MATAGGKAKDTTDKLRSLIREEFGSLFEGERKKSSRANETKEQGWIRQAIREEVGDFFDAFTKALTGGDEEEKAGKKDGGEEEGDVIDLKGILGLGGKS